MTAATAFCTSNTVFYPNPAAAPRSSLTSVILRPSTSPSSDNIRSQSETAPLIDKVKSDENNNDQYQESSLANLDDVLYITSDDDDDDDHDAAKNPMADSHTQPTRTQNPLDQDEFLALVGLRPKGYKATVPDPIPLSLAPLNKRLPCPVCLLPLPKRMERVRQALMIRLPFLKFLRITHDFERYCATDDSAKVQSLLPRALSKTRSLIPLKRRTKNQKLSKTALIHIAGESLANPSNSNSNQKNDQLHAILQCHVALDRLEQATIDQIMQNCSGNNDGDPMETTSDEQQASRRRSHSSSKLTKQTTTTTTTCTMITTTTKTEKMIIKRKSTTSTADHSMERKRFKSSSNDLSSRRESEAAMFERIYLKCFLCSKRQYISATSTDSNVLHTHWLAHGGNVLMNIYDSEIDSILTRVVEFFKSSKQHTLEGKIHTIFILDSKEVQRSPKKHVLPTDSYIVID